MMVDRREFDSLKAHCERQARQIKAKDAEIAKLKTQIGGNNETSDKRNYPHKCG